MTAARLRVELLPRFAEHSILEVNHAVEIDVIVGKLRNVVERLFLQQTVAQQMLQRDQQRIARVRRMASIRRIAIAGRIERQDLPDANAGAPGPIEKGDHLVAEVANSIPSGEGGRMQKHAGGALLDHPWASALMVSFSPRASKCCSQRLAADEPLPAFAATTGRTTLRMR